MDEYENTLEEVYTLNSLKDRFDYLLSEYKNELRNKSFLERVSSFFSLEPEDLAKARKKYNNYVYYLESKKRDYEEEQFKKHKFEVYRNFRESLNTSEEYNDWKENVFRLKGKKCEHCGDDKRLEIHHVISLHSIFNAYQKGNISLKKMKELLYRVSNGQVLCKKCHSMTRSSIYWSKTNK